MWFVALASAIIALLQLLPWLHVRQVIAVWPERGLDALTLRRLARKPWADRLALASERLQPGSWPQILCAELHTATNDRQKLMLINDAVRQAEASLGARDAWPRISNRLTLLVAALALVAGLLAGARLTLLWLLPAMVLGLLSGSAAQRASQASAQRQRTAVDAFIAALAGELAFGDDGSPIERRSWRHRRRRAR